MIFIDGSEGEGGGQILRTALALSVAAGKPFHISEIRARRKKPGLMRQHLAAVNAAAAISHAAVTGNTVGSRELSFAPAKIKPGSHRFSIGTAGSCTLVLQTVLPPLLIAPEPSELTLEGGTHNPGAPPFDFIRAAFLPIVECMGPKVSARLERPGFYPAGGGRMHVRVEPARRLAHIALLERGAVRKTSARALVARLPESIGRRELGVIAERLGLDGRSLRIEAVADSAGPGNAVLVFVESARATEVFTGFGEKGVPAEKVAGGAAAAAAEYLAADVPVGRHLADQLLVPMALAGGGRFRTLSPTEHTRTNIGVIERFLDVAITLTDAGGGAWEADVEKLPPEAA